MCVSAKAQEEKCVESLQKKTNGRNFPHTKFSVIGLVLTDRRNLPGTLPKSACGKFSAARNAINKATQYVTFGFPFPISVFFSF